MYKKGLLSKYKVPLAHWRIFNKLAFNCVMTVPAPRTLLSSRRLFCFIPSLWVCLLCFVWRSEDKWVNVFREHSYWPTYYHHLLCPGAPWKPYVEVTCSSHFLPPSIHVSPSWSGNRFFMIKPQILLMQYPPAILPQVCLMIVLQVSSQG